jgi:hypothetical protein
MIERNPASELSAPRLATRRPQSLSRQDIQQLLAQPRGTSAVALRDRALLELLYGCGIRVSEAIALQPDELDLGTAMLRADANGPKERLVAVPRQRADRDPRLPATRPPAAPATAQAAAPVRKPARERAHPPRDLPDRPGPRAHSRAGRAMLTFIAQDGQQHTIIYANAELTARAQSGEVIDFCRFYERTHGELPKLLVFDGKLTTHEHLAELDELGVAFITLRQRSPKLIATLEQLPANGWTKTRLDRAGKHKTATYHEHPITLKGRTCRQLAVKGLGRDQPTLLLTNRRDVVDLLWVKPEGVVDHQPLTLARRQCNNPGHSGLGT